VAARRLLILMLVLLGVSTIAAALVPVDRNAGDEQTTNTTTATRQRPTGELVPKSIDANAEEPKTIRVHVGDQLQLRVKSPKRPDEVEIPALDELDDVDPDADAHFDLLLFDAGTYQVRLVDAQRKIGEIVVRSRQPPKDSNGSKRPKKRET
jgi:hypothetical protein